MVLSKPENKHVLKAFDLSGKVAAVTGGARGIGLEVCRGLAEAGANVALIYTSSTDAPDTAASISSSTNTQCRAYQADVRDAKKIDEVLQQIASDYGKLDIVVANAGVASHFPAEEFPQDEYTNIMKINLDGAWYTAQAAGRIFKKAGSGNLIFTASVSASLVNVPQKQAPYNASKAAVVRMAKCLAVEWVDFARVNCVSPGFIATDMLAVHPKEWRDKWFQLVPAQRLCDPYELKGAYVFAASDASSYMTGADLIIDGAYTLP